MNTKQRKYDLVKGALVVGVDTGKRGHVAALRAPWKSVEKRVAFDNDLKGFQRLAEEVDQYRERMKLSRVVLGIEPTGHYWLPLAYWWEENKGPVVLVNPMHTNRAKELEDNSPLKSDPKDADVISWAGIRREVPGVPSAERNICDTAEFGATESKVWE